MGTVVVAPGFVPGGGGGGSIDTRGAAVRGYWGKAGGFLFFSPPLLLFQMERFPPAVGFSRLGTTAWRDVSGAQRTSRTRETSPSRSGL